MTDFSACHYQREVWSLLNSEEYHFMWYSKFWSQQITVVIFTSILIS